MNPGKLVLEAIDDLDDGDGADREEVLSEATDGDDLSEENARALLDSLERRGEVYQNREDHYRVTERVVA